MGELRIAKWKPWLSRELAQAIYLLAGSTVALYVMKRSWQKSWLGTHAIPVVNVDAAWWQVQTTFLAVGFAGIAIAAQLFAETPTAIGATRTDVFNYVRAPRFVIYSIAANLVTALEATWLQSREGMLVVGAWAVASVWLMIASYVQLVGLLSHPSGSTGS